MAASDAAGAELSKDSEMIRIGSRLWKIGDKVYSIGVEAVEKAKMVETFGDAWKTALLALRSMGLFKHCWR